MPPELLRLAALELDGQLGMIHDAWHGWTLSTRSGALETPQGWSFSPAELIAMPLRYQLIRALEHELKMLRADRQREFFEPVYTFMRPRRLAVDQRKPRAHRGPGYTGAERRRDDRQHVHQPVHDADAPLD
jgi:hypothetical protein